jgi:hypothetical protein
MTTLAYDRRVSPVQRTLAAARILFIPPYMGLGLPLLILTTAFVVNVMVFASVEQAREAATGGVMSLYISQFIMAWVSVHQSFSFLVGLNVSRRVFWVASLVVVVLESLLYGVVLLLGAIIEGATDGWGIGLRFFDPSHLTGRVTLPSYLVYTVPLLALSVFGLFLGAITKRFGTRGTFLLSTVATLVFGGGASLISYLDGWSAVGAWLARQSVLSITIGWVLVPTALAAVLGWLALRRAVP